VTEIWNQTAIVFFAVLDCVIYEADDVSSVISSTIRAQ
jgi:hypothetical protein